jgi:hypothetical protein
MTSVHLHLLLNHVPILGSLFALILLAAGLLRGRTEIVRAALWTLTAIALLTVPVYLSGGEAEDQVKPLPGVSTILLEEHEEAALPAMLTIVGAGVLSLIALVLGRGGRPLPRWLSGAVVAFTLLGFAMVARVGYLGGQVRHSEVRSSAPAQEEHDGRGRGGNGRH